MSSTRANRVLEANREIVKSGLSILTWGNASLVDRDKELVHIKPSGINLSEASAEDIAVVGLSSGTHVSGLNASVDTKTHLELYNSFDNIGGVVHTHSVFATAFAQSNTNIPCLGTTHADYFNGAIPCIGPPSPEEVEEDYELFTGKNIVKYFKENAVNPDHVPGALVRGHGVFCWGYTIELAVEHAIIIEKIAEMAVITLGLDSYSRLDPYILNKHFQRKHGKDSYYGQK